MIFDAHTVVQERQTSRRHNLRLVPDRKNAFDDVVSRNILMCARNCRIDATLLIADGTPDCSKTPKSRRIRDAGAPVERLAAPCDRALHTRGNRRMFIFRFSLRRFHLPYCTALAIQMACNADDR